MYLYLMVSVRVTANLNRPNPLFWPRPVYTLIYSLVRGFRRRRIQKIHGVPKIEPIFYIR